MSWWLLRVVIAKGRKSQDPCQNCLETGACGVSFNLLTSVTTRGFCGPPNWGKLRVHLLSPSHFKLAGHLHDVAKVASKKINYYLILKICNPELGPRRWLFRLAFSLYCSTSVWEVFILSSRRLLLTRKQNFDICCTFGANLCGCIWLFCICSL